MRVRGGGQRLVSRLVGASAVVAGLSAFGMLSLSGCVRKRVQLPTAADSISVPYQVFDRANLFFYDGPRKKWKLDALYMRKQLDSQGAITVAPVRLTLYDSLGATSTTVLADSGATTGSMANFTAWGNVLITTDDHMIIKTQKLLWNKNTHTVTSDTYVQIRTANGDIVRGKGLDAVEDFSQWSFRSNVTGEFPNFKDRFEGEDKLF